MERSGVILFWTGVAIAVGIGLIVSLDPGWVCRLETDTPPQTPWSYQALCFLTWAFGVPVGLILAAGGALLLGGAPAHRALGFLIGIGALYLIVSLANGPMPHVPPLFGIGGAVILLFYFLILWGNRESFARNGFRLAGYTLLVIGFWFTCGLGSRQYQPAMGPGESPIDIMFYFAAAMGFFWIGERRGTESRPR